MNKNGLISAFLVVALGISFVGCSSYSDTSKMTPSANTTTLITKSKANKESKNTNSYSKKTQYISTTLDKIKTYSDLKSLEIAPYVFTGICISSRPVFQNNTLYTLSKLKLTEVFKGSLSVGDTVSVVELGGRTTYGEYKKECNISKKSFEIGDDSIPDDCNVVVGTDGFFPLEKDDEVLLFVGDTSGFLKDFKEPLFDIMGAYDGKLYPSGKDAYSRNSPSSTNIRTFGKNTLKITKEQLKVLK